MAPPPHRPVARSLPDAWFFRPRLRSPAEPCAAPPPATPPSLLRAWTARQRNSPSAPAVASATPPAPVPTSPAPVCSPPVRPPTHLAVFHVRELPSLAATPSRLPGSSLVQLPTSVDA